MELSLHKSDQASGWIHIEGRLEGKIKIDGEWSAGDAAVTIHSSRLFGETQDYRLWISRTGKGRFKSADGVHEGKLRWTQAWSTKDRRPKQTEGEGGADGPTSNKEVPAAANALPGAIGSLKKS
jgi:hypothetical protein